MFSRNKEYEVSYKAFETLMKCLHEAEFDEEIFMENNRRTALKDEMKKRFLKSSRLQAARCWIHKYDGPNLVKILNLMRNVYTIMS